MGPIMRRAMDKASSSCSNDGMLNRTVTAMSAWVAHALAWVAGLWMVFGPVYQGVSVTPSMPGEPAGETTRHTHTLVEANGLWVLWLLLIPVLLSGAALLAVVFTGTGQARRRALLWTPALALLAFCVVGIFSIGLFYLPAALAMQVAAITDSLKGSAADAGSQDSG